MYKIYNLLRNKWFDRTIFLHNMRTKRRSAVSTKQQQI